MTEAPLDGARLLVVGATAWLDSFTDALRTETDVTLRRAETAQAAIDAVRERPIDCLVTEHALGGTTGVELIRRVREPAPDLPVVLATTAGSETVASEAVAAGVTEYVPVTPDGSGSIPALLERTAQALQSGRRATRRRERARQFDAVFEDTQTATWVLDPDGVLTRVNRTGSELVGEDAAAIVGREFWTLPPWSRSDATSRDVRQFVRTARDGQFGTAVVFQAPAGRQRVVEFSARPVENGRGDVVSIVVEGIDITEQVALERDLRQSEQLHRVTLNNMTDTVLITDEDGEYTYICPNVNFIFGYTAEEIRAQGTIDGLLGSDLFDREALATSGVLKNIECTVTDKAGREHTLLVNVREVSIQDGTLLYSCRDITKRKQREQALATLQETAREFLYAETRQQIAGRVVDSVESAVGLPASAVYLFDIETNELRPAAHSGGMTELHGPLRTVHTDGESLPSDSFVNDETAVFDDVHTSARLANRATDLRSAMYIPLGSHGVFVIGSSEVGAFDEVTQELADLLAATAEAALDRVDRESQLREQDRELQRRNDQLTTLNEINDTIREIDQAVVRAETREEITHTVCERLTATDRFKFAWVGSLDAPSETVEPEAWAGDEQGYLDSQPFAVAESGVEPAGRTAATGEVTMVSNVAADLRVAAWRSDALTRDFLTVLSLPLAYNGLRHGVLTIYADTRDAFDEMTRTVLRELGETIAAALSALKRKRALLTSSMTRVEFTVDDQRFLLSRLARRASCALSYEGGIQHTAAGDSVFVTVDGAPVQTVADAAREMAAIDEVTRISGDDSGGVLRLGLTRPFLALELADHGAIFRAATADPTAATLVIDVPGSDDVRSIAQVVRNTFSTVSLQRKETLDQGGEDTLQAQFLASLTDRQFEVIQTAYYSGYFASPREHSGEDVAETLGISPTAFYQHVRTVQRKLFDTLFDGHSGSVTATDA